MPNASTSFVYNVGKKKACQNSSGTDNTSANNATSSGVFDWLNTLTGNNAFWRFALVQGDLQAGGGTPGDGTTADTEYDVTAMSGFGTLGRYNTHGTGGYLNQELAQASRSITDVAGASGQSQFRYGAQLTYTALTATGSPSARYADGGVLYRATDTSSPFNNGTPFAWIATGQIPVAGTDVKIIFNSTAVFTSGS